MLWRQCDRASTGSISTDRWGSLALGDYEAGASDVDALAVTEGTWTDRDLAELRRLHARLIRAEPLARRLDLAYVPWRDLGNRGAVAPQPVVRDGRFRPADRGGLDAVTRWLIMHRGITLVGPAGDDLSLPVA